MTIVLSSDWHLTDNEQDEYRWNAFAEADRIMMENNANRLYILGDICDRRDRHSSVLVNRLRESLRKLGDGERSVTILAGDHDLATGKPAFWDLLNDIFGIAFALRPHSFRDGLLTLPFNPNPTEAWAGYDLAKYKAIFCHKKMNGAAMENGRLYEQTDKFTFPDGSLIYSGDIHTPQRVGNVTYVGAPHPIDFGDNYLTRMLVLDDDYRLKCAAPTKSIRKIMLDVSSLDEMNAAGFKMNQGDQVKVRIRVPAAGVEDVAKIEQYVASQARLKGATVFGTSVEVVNDATGVLDEDRDPAVTLANFCRAEGVIDEMRGAGSDMLQEAMRATDQA